GTFYVPRHASRGVMSDAEIRELSTQFGVGAHTIDHVDVTTIDDAGALRQMQDSKAWVESITGRSCPLFCFPKGRFRARHLALARSSGFTGVRTTELLSTNSPATVSGGLRVIPTSVQARPHATISYLRNAVKRASVVGLAHLLSVGTDRGWPSLS